MTSDLQMAAWLPRHLPGRSRSSPLATALRPAATGHRVGWWIHGAWWLHCYTRITHLVSFTGPHWQQYHLAYFFHGFHFFLRNGFSLSFVIAILTVGESVPGRDWTSFYLVLCICLHVVFAIFGSVLREWLILRQKVNKEIQNKIGGLLWGSLPEQQKPKKSDHFCRFAVVYCIVTLCVLVSGVVYIAKMIVKQKRTNPGKCKSNMHNKSKYIAMNFQYTVIQNPYMSLPNKMS